MGECESCQISIDKYGFDDLEICTGCDHLFFKKCTCGALQHPFHIGIET